MQGAEQGLMLIKFGVTLLLPDTCDVHHEVKLRNRFVITKHIYGAAADDASAGRTLYQPSFFNGLLQCASLQAPVLVVSYLSVF